MNSVPSSRSSSQSTQLSLESGQRRTPLSSAADEQRALATALLDSKKTVQVDGYTLTLGDVVAVARNGRACEMSADGRIKERIDQSVAFLKSKLTSSIYGVSTGFGGSADTRTQAPLALQLSLLEHQLCGVLPSSFDDSQFMGGRGMENVMPEEVVRGAMLIRVNSLSRGHSAVRTVVLDTLLKFLAEGLTPVVPLRGSISASGDLSPLSYIAGAITGHPDIKVITPKGIMLAPAALAAYGIEKIVMGPKEGLGLVNGTAVSASIGSMVMHDAHFLSLLSQATTAMTVEAMVGHVGSFDPFIHDVTRPHPGQREVAKNIRTVLQGSRFAVHHEEEVGVKEDEGVLRQDRYPLRTSAQWLGPLVSDLVHSHAQIQIELNSTTDNPLIDVEGGTIHHGGNFQAMAVTNAMEKTRLGVQQMGKLGFAQMTELVNCSMNRGLPSCLAFEDPSTSYHTKGCDIAAAAYTSELGFLANPVSTHVQSAEMSNQAVNSLALISARKTVEALDVLAMLLSTHLYCILQALDLRTVEFAFRASFTPTLLPSLTSHFSQFLTPDQLKPLSSKLNSTLWRRLEQTGSMDLEDRWEDAYNHSSSLVLDALATSSTLDGNPIQSLRAWKEEGTKSAIDLTRSTRNSFFSPSRPASLDTREYLGKTVGMYVFVRETIGVECRRGDVFLGKQEQTVGTGVAKIYEAVKSGRMNEVLLEMFA